ncbi:MAG: LamG-like jellyroll fold domain-containing protein [Bacilli bacterium]
MKNKSFTLIELLVVIVIIGILAGVIMISTSSSIDKANIAKSKVFEESVQNNLAVNMVSRWKLDEIDKPTAGKTPDAWGSNTGTLGDGATATTFPTLKTSNECVSDGCYNFDGGDYINLGNDSSLNITNELTISVWIKPNNVNADFLRVVHKADTSGLLRGYGIAQSSTNGKFVGFYQKNYSTVEFNKRTSVILQNGQWYNIVMTWNGVESSAGILMHVNGSECSEDTTTTDYGWSATGAGFNIGRRAGSAGYFFNGLIDDVRIYDAALSSSQIKQNYIAGLNSMLANGNISKAEYDEKIESLGSI